MWQRSETISLTESIFTILRDLIHDRTGIFYDSAKRELLAEKLTGPVLELGLSSFLDYYYLLKYGPDDEQEWPRVLDALSVPETYFWREIAQIRAFVDTILPGHVASHRNEPIGIWCAACATGEEPLTIAMVLQEAGWFDRAPIGICATDASPAAIAKASRGFYRERSFRTLPKPLQDKYFTVTAGGWQVEPLLSSKVTFSIVNLMSGEEMEPFAGVPFIFCRNVFIYFSQDAIARTIRRFAEKMIRPGYLFVGASESLLKLSTDFNLQPAGDAFAYHLK
jgi:chemotaxis protein methyltransferase CheR